MSIGLPTMAEMIDRAINEGELMAEVTYTRFMPGTVLSPALAAMMNQDCGVFWMLTAIASWVTCGGTDSGGDGFDLDGNGMNPGTYRRLIERWASMRDAMQVFEMRRHGRGGAELCVCGGADETQDDSLTLHPIQRWGYAQVPWSDDKPLRVMAGRQWLDDARSVWVLMLPREY